MLVDLAPIGGNGSVNPKYVTSIEPSGHDGDTRTVLWVVGHAGYGTYSTFVHVSPYEAKQYLSDPDKFIHELCVSKLQSFMDSLRSEGLQRHADAGPRDQTNSTVLLRDVIGLLQHERGS